MYLPERDDVPSARSSFSHRITDRPRPAASRATPAPLMPPPMTSRSIGLTHVFEASSASAIGPETFSGLGDLGIGQQDWAADGQRVPVLPGQGLQFNGAPHGLVQVLSPSAIIPWLASRQAVRFSSACNAVADSSTVPKVA